MPSRLVLLSLLLLPLAEIAVFVLVGQKIGVAATILAVLGSSFAGLMLMRRQGIGMMRNLQAAQTGEGDGKTVMRGMLHMVAGLLLVIPGFVTSALGLLLLLPFTRGFLWRSLKPDVIVTRSAQFYRRPAQPGSENRSGPSVIDLDTEEFHRDESPEKRGSTGSPWSIRDEGNGDEDRRSGL